MAAPQPKTLLPPLGGLDRSVAYQSQKPFTTPDCENYFPQDAFLQRDRGGSRPGSFRLHKTSGSDPIRLIHSVTVKNPGSAFAFKSDSFNYGSFPASRWTSSISGLTSAAPTISGGKVIGNKGDATEQKALLHAAISDMKTTATSDTYVLGVYVLPYLNAHHGVYSLYFRMASSPALSSSLEARLTITGAGTLTIALYKDGSGSPLVTWTPTAETVTQEGWFEVQWTKGATNDTIEAFWRGESAGSTATSTGTSTDNRFGFGLKATTAGGRVQVDRFRVQYYKTAAHELLRPITVMVQNGQILRDKNWFGRFEALASNLRLANDRALQAVERGQKLYLADNSEPVASGTDGVVSGGNTFDSATYSDWTTILSSSTGTSTYFGNFVVHVTAPTGSAGIYPITALASGSLTIARAINATGLTFRIERGPKIYDPVADTLTAWAADVYNTGTIDVTDGVVTLSGTGAEAPDWTEGAYMFHSGSWYFVSTLDTDTQWTLTDTSLTGVTGADYALIRGTVPCGCKSIAKLGDRILLSADALDPNEYYGSGLGQPGDWLFGNTGPGAAFKGANPDAGRVGDAVISMMEYSQDLVLFGCRNSLFLMAGAPPSGGSLDNVSHRTSLLSLTSWCAGPGGETYWLGRDGMYLATPQCLACEPEPVSKEKLPLEMQDLNPELVTACLEYDHGLDGIFITLTPVDATADVTHFFYRPNLRAFFPVVFGSTAGNPTALRWVNMPDSEDSLLLMGGSAGSVRAFSYSAANDADAAITSRVVYGPVLLGGPGGRGYGSIAEILVKMGEESGPTTLKVYHGKTAQAAVDALETQTPESFTLGAGDSYSIHPRVRDGAAVLEFVGTAGRHWVNENVQVFVSYEGERRV